LTNIKDWRVVNPYDDDIEGEDRVGCTFIFNKNPLTDEEGTWTYWYGSILGQGMSPYFGPTVLQVCSGVLSCIKWMTENPERGPCYAEDIPKDFILKNARPFLGKVVSEPMPWKPVSTQFVDMQNMAIEKLRRMNATHYD